MAGKGATELSKDERILIEEGCKRGYRIGTISSGIGRTYSCVKQELIRGGGKEKYNAKDAQDLADFRKEQKKFKQRKHLSENQIDLLKECLENGDSINRISKIMGYSYWKTTDLITRLGLEKPKQKNYTAFVDRLEALEAQVATLFELISEKI